MTIEKHLQELSVEGSYSKESEGCGCRTLRYYTGDDICVSITAHYELELLLFSVETPGKNGLCLKGRAPYNTVTSLMLNGLVDVVRRGSL